MSAGVTVATVLCALPPIGQPPVFSAYSGSNNTVANANAPKLGARKARPYVGARLVHAHIGYDFF